MASAAGSKGGRGAPWRICAITTTRADFGVWTPALDALAAAPGVALGLIATGSHLRADLGGTIAEVEASGHPIWARPHILLADDGPAGAVKAMALTQLAMADLLAGDAPGLGGRPDLLMALGDRFETFAAVAAAQPFRIPVLHLHGGEETEGAIDNAFRHAITKLSHLHCVATETAARRVRAMGEDPARVVVTGAPGLDRLLAAPDIPPEALARRFGLPPPPYLLITYHPETLSPAAVERDFAAVLEGALAAAEAGGLALVFTAANADPGGAAVNRMIRAAVAADPARRALVASFGEAYAAAARGAAAMLGNSSSGVIEAATLGVPAVNVGDRQKGRERSANTLDVPHDAAAIAAALARACAPDFRAAAAAAGNVYGDGRAGPRIRDAALAFLAAGPSTRKAFHLAG